MGSFYPQVDHLTMAAVGTGAKTAYNAGPGLSRPESVSEHNLNKPEVTLYIAPGCAYCPTVLQALSELVKQGELSRLEVINIAAAEQLAQSANVQTVPTVVLGGMRLTGQRSPSELRTWISRFGHSEGAAMYLTELLKTGRLADAVDYVVRESGAMEALLQLLRNEDTGLPERLGISAVFEELEGSEVLQRAIPALGAMLEDRVARLQGDAAHFLGLSRSAEAIPFLEKIDESYPEEVREIAQESLALIEQNRK